MSLANALRILEMRQTKGKSPIQFHYIVPARISAGKMRLLLTSLFKVHGKRPSAVNYVFCSDKYLLKINQEYLNHDTLTDIITFDLSDSPAEVVADIYISVERVRENATGLGISFSAELRRVIIHGALHLVGFKDKTRSERARIRSAEDNYLSLFESTNVPRETKAKKKFHVKHGKRVS